MAWTDVFGGQTINPQSISYAAYEFDADATFLWPTTAATGNVVTDIMDITTTAAGVTLTMPDARRAGPGQASLIYNAGAETFSVVSATGVAIQSIAPGEGWYVWMRDNSTESGQWRTVQFGAGTSSASAAALASQTVKASGSALVQAMPVFDISSNFTVGANERGKLINWTGGTGTVTLTAAGTLGDDWFCAFRNTGSGALTIATGSGDDISGDDDITINPSESVMIVCDGSNFAALFRTQEPDNDFTLTSISVAGSGDFTLSSGQLGFSSYVFTGTLTGNRNIIVPATVAPYRVRNNTTGSFTLTVKTASGTGVVVEQDNGKFLVCDGTNVIDQVTPGIATPIAISDGGTGATSASSARTNLGATSVGNTLFTAASESAGRDAIGLGTAATQNDDRYAHRANNLSDLANAATARTNLGLGTAALVNVGTSEGQVPVLGSDGKFDEGVLPDIASDASEVSYDDSVTDFGLAPADLNVQKAIEATKEYIDTVAASITVTQSDVRQTVNTGPVDSDGRAGFLEAGSGLEVVTSGVSESTPLNITFGDGFDADGKRDVVVVIDSSLSWGSLPDNEDAISLFIRVDRDTGAVTTEASTLAPIYSAAEPSAPATGQKWYPTDHRAPMREWDGAAWNDDDLIICVGQCSTDGGSVVEVRSYAYQGRASTEFIARANVNTHDHNIGTEKLNPPLLKLKFASGQAGYAAGDVAYPVWSGGGATAHNASATINAIQIRTSSNNVVVQNYNGGGNTSISANALFGYDLQRSF